jgi:hypothetical protein
MNSIRLTVAFLAAIVLAGGAHGQPAPPPSAPGGITVPSCASEDSLRFLPGDASAVLDDDDVAMVSDALSERYPVLQRDGFAPSRIVLWQKANGELLYVALQPRPEASGGVCFTATFVASRLEMTASLIRKYFYLTSA